MTFHRKTERDEHEERPHKRLMTRTGEKAREEVLAATTSDQNDADPCDSFDPSASRVYKERTENERCNHLCAGDAKMQVREIGKKIVENHKELVSGATSGKFKRYNPTYADLLICTAPWRKIIDIQKFLLTAVAAEYLLGADWIGGRGNIRQKIMTQCRAIQDAEIPKVFVTNPMEYLRALDTLAIDVSVANIKLLTYTPINRDQYYEKLMTYPEALDFRDHENTTAPGSGEFVQMQEDLVALLKERGSLIEKSCEEKIRKAQQVLSVANQRIKIYHKTNADLEEKVASHTEQQADAQSGLIQTHKISNDSTNALKILIGLTSLKESEVLVSAHSGSSCDKGVQTRLTSKPLLDCYHTELRSARKVKLGKLQERWDARRAERQRQAEKEDEEFEKQQKALITG